MSEIKAFFRGCPSCGRRFQIKLVGKNLVSEEAHKENLTPLQSEMTSALIPATSRVPTIVGEGEPIIVEVEDFQYTYRCKHCGHVYKYEKAFGKATIVTEEPRKDAKPFVPGVGVNRYYTSETRFIDTTKSKVL